MFGNGHVRFLRGCGRAIVQSYLTNNELRAIFQNQNNISYPKQLFNNPITKKYTE